MTPNRIFIFSISQLSSLSKGLQRWEYASLKTKQQRTSKDVIRRTLNEQQQQQNTLKGRCCWRTSQISFNEKVRPQLCLMKACARRGTKNGYNYMVYDSYLHQYLDLLV